MGVSTIVARKVVLHALSWLENTCGKLSDQDSMKQKCSHCIATPDYLDENPDNLAYLPIMSIFGRH
jgi:hypothetical protein